MCWARRLASAMILASSRVKQLAVLVEELAVNDDVRDVGGFGGVDEVVSKL